jgi:energy-coupling factor transporter ATP-binding protein EcfA2
MYVSVCTMAGPNTASTVVVSTVRKANVYVGRARGAVRSVRCVRSAGGSRGCWGGGERGGVRVHSAGDGKNAPETLADVMGTIFAGLEALANQQGVQKKPSGAHVVVEDVSYHPPSSDVPLLDHVSLSVEPNTIGLIYGCSGGGKSSLLHVLAGLSAESEGRVSFSGPSGPFLDSTARMKDAGIVFQFPERHFVGRTLQEELTLGWPVHGPDAMVKQQLLTTRTYQVLDAVGLRHIALDTPLETLSGGYKRRVALAVQLIRQPRLLLLDEPLAGLDWKARHELVGVLEKMREDCTVLVVSHDLGEVETLVTRSYRMRKGGRISSD